MTPHHVGYLVKNMEKAIKEFICLGYEKRSEIVFDSARGIDICFMEKMGLSVELVTPAGDNSVVTSLIKKTGSSPYHICYAVKDLKKSDEELRARGYIPIGEPLPALTLQVEILLNINSKGQCRAYRAALLFVKFCIYGIAL